MSFDKILEFEHELAKFTSAPYAIMTDCCTHAIELCLRYDKVQWTEFTAYTYLSVLMTMHKLGTRYKLVDEKWTGEYNFKHSRIWDSARKLTKGMYYPGMMQCLSFGHTKPLEIGHGGAILLDDKKAYDTIIRQRYDGRDLTISPWQDQQMFKIGYHYRPTIEDAIIGLEKLPLVDEKPKYVEYPDLRKIKISS